MKRCHRCAEKIQDSAQVCRFCGAEQAKVEKQSGRTVLLVAAGVLVLFYIVSRFNGGDKKTVEAPVELSAKPAVKESETGERIPAADAAEYTLLSSEKLANGNVTALSRRVSSQSGASYSYREYQCEKGMVRYWGSGDTKAAAEVKRFASDPFGRLVEGSSAYLTGKVACARYGKPVIAP